MQSVPNSPLIMHATASSSAIIAKPARRQPATTTQRPPVVTPKQAHDQSAPVSPPAKKTNPDANDAAARAPRACPRPVGYAVQLLLVALYISTYDDVVEPDQNAVRAHLTTHHARNGSIISNHRNPARRQPSTTTQRPLVVTAKQAHDQSAPVEKPPAKKTNPDANDAPAR